MDKIWDRKWSRRTDKKSKAKNKNKNCRTENNTYFGWTQTQLIITKLKQKNWVEWQVSNRLKIKKINVNRPNKSWNVKPNECIFFFVSKVEISPYFNNSKLRDFCMEKGITVTAYAPLGAPGRTWWDILSQPFLYFPFDSFTLNGSVQFPIFEILGL